MASLIRCEEVLPIALVVSSLTDNELLHELNTHIGDLQPPDLNQLRISFVFLSLSLPECVLDSKHHFSYIFDFTNSVQCTNALSLQSTQVGFIHFVLARQWLESGNEVPQPFSIYMDSSDLAEVTALLDMAEFFHWSQVGIVCDDMSVIHKVEAVFTTVQVHEQIILSGEETLGTLSQLMDSVLGTSDTRVFFVLTESSLATKVLAAADSVNIGTAGYAWVVGTEGMRTLWETHTQSWLSHTGVVGLQESTSVLTSIHEAVRLVHESYANLPAMTEVYESILRTYPNGFKASVYKIVNIKSFIPVLVGEYTSFDRLIRIDSPILWPGFTHEAPSSAVLTLVLLYPLHNQEGKEVSEARSIRQGFDLGITEINSHPDLLPAVTLRPVYIDTFESVVLAPVCLAEAEKYAPVGYIGSRDSEVTAEFHSLLSNNTKPRAFVSYGASAEFLSAPELFPNLFRAVQTDRSQGVAVALFLQEFGLTKVGLIYTSDALGLGLAQGFKENADSLGIRIANEESNQIIKCTNKVCLNSETEASIDAALAEIVRKQLKIIVYLGHDFLAPLIAKVAYQKELYGAEYAWVGSKWLSPLAQELIDTHYSEEESGIYSVLDGAIGLADLGAEGPFGEDFAESFVLSFNQTYTLLSLYAYDSVYIFAHAIHSMLTDRQDPHDLELLLDELRGLSFVGASGKIQFAGNNREPIGYSFLNMQKGTLVKVYNYRPNDAVQLTAEENTLLQWSGDSVPSTDWEDSLNCPFASHMVSTSETGLGIIIGIGLFLLALSLVLTSCAVHKWKLLLIQPVSPEETRTWKDTLAELSILVEFFQLIAIAPKFYLFEWTLETVANLFTLDLVKATHSDPQNFWSLLSVFCGFLALWFLLVLLIIFNADSCLRSVKTLQEGLVEFNAVYLPFFGNTMFLPMTSILLDPFVCDRQAQGHSVVRRDCYMNCWTFDHGLFAGTAAVIFVLYFPLAVYSRPVWQESRKETHVLATPRFICGKTLVEILLVVVTKSLQGVSPTAHGVIFTLIMTCFAWCSYKAKPFNYEPCNLYQIVSLIAVAYLSALATSAYWLYPHHYGWGIALGVVWVLLCLAILWLRLTNPVYKNLLKSSSRQFPRVRPFDSVPNESFRSPREVGESAHFPS